MRTVKRYDKLTIIFHWVHTFVFIMLVGTGTAMFIPGTEVDLVTRHCVAGIIFIAMPVIYGFYDPRKFAHYIKEILTWSKDDLRWLRTAPGYYFGGSSDKMPAQDHMNTGQKLWQLVICVTGLVFVITGATMWLFKSNISINTYQDILLIHDIAFIVVFVMFLVHIYMSLFHPGNRESISSMIDGKVSPEYAKKHYRKWYDETGEKQ